MRTAKKKGSTLVEATIVMLVIGVLVSICIPS
jgi:Tfp pilus assembly protein PilE